MNRPTANVTVLIPTPPDGQPDDWHWLRGQVVKDRHIWLFETWWEMKSVTADSEVGSYLLVLEALVRG